MRKPELFRCGDGYDAVDLLAYAMDHYAAARRLFGQNPGFRYYDSAAYLAHLAIELLLKAVSLHLSDQFQGLHDLERLADLARQDGFKFEVSGELAGTLYIVNSFEASRYPCPADPITVGTDDRANIDQLWASLVDALPEPLRSAFETSPGNVKGGRVLMVRDGPPPLGRNDVSST